MPLRLLMLSVALALISGCMWAPLLQNPQETNIAPTARSTDPLINDNQYDTIGTTQEGKPRVFVLQFPQKVRVHKIIIHNYNLFRFRLDAWDDRNMRWKTLKTVKQRRDVTGEDRLAQPKYEFPRLNVTTDKLRIAVSRTVDDSVIPKATVTPEDKILNVETSSAYRLGYYYRVLVEATAQIREVQVYGRPADR